MTKVRVLRLALARLMDTDEALQDLEWFKLYKGITLDDPENEGNTWEEYLIKVGYTNEYADQLQVMCMALFVGKDIMQTCPDYPESDPWVKIPGHIDGWPHPATRPAVTLFYTGLRGVQHYEPIMFVGDRVRTLGASEEDQDAQLRAKYSANKEKLIKWERAFKMKYRRTPVRSDMPESIRSCLNDCTKIQAHFRAKEKLGAINSRVMGNSTPNHRSRASNEDEGVGMEEDEVEVIEVPMESSNNEVIEVSMESSNNNNDNDSGIVMVDYASNEAHVTKETPSTPIDESTLTAKEVPTPKGVPTPRETPINEASNDFPVTKSVEEEKNTNLRKLFKDYYSNILAWEQDFERANGRKPKFFERTPEIKKCYRNCEYIQTKVVVAIEPPKTEQKMSNISVSVQMDNATAEIKDIAKIATDPQDLFKTSSDAQEDISKHPTLATSKLSNLRMFRRQPRLRRPGGPGAGLRL